MRRTSNIPMITLAAAAALVAGGCDRGEEASGTLSEAPAVPLVDSSGQIIGEVRGGDGEDGATLLIEARGLPPGEHGMHIHEVGICEGPGFTSAGPHWNPTNAQHGGENPQGAHMGDLENVTVGSDGSLRAEIIVPGTYLRSEGRDVRPGARQILDASGAAIVIHAGADDYRTDPSGNSGGRIACAVLGSPEPGAVVAPEAGGNAANVANATAENGAMNEAAAAPANTTQNSATQNVAN